jgi:hypothetical protein
MKNFLNIITIPDINIILKLRSNLKKDSNRFLSCCLEILDNKIAKSNGIVNQIKIKLSVNVTLARINKKMSSQFLTGLQK